MESQSAMKHTAMKPAAKKHAAMAHAAVRKAAWLLLALATTPAAWAAATPEPATAETTPAAATVAVIPRPAHIQLQGGAFALDARTRIVAHGGAEAQRIAQDLAARLQRSRGLSPRVGTGNATAPAIRLRLDPLADIASGEGYRLAIDADGVAITARQPAGLYYGAVTVWQLATADGGRGATTLPGLRIDDAPRFAWRGLMLDVARHFRSVDEVKALIDQMALHKLNTLHWHLTDDQGWRIEIKRYPKLTQIGGCRIPAGAAGKDEKGAPHPYCGYYTQEQIRDVVRYAAQRYITVVPELDLPGHAQAAIAAYPELGVTGQTPPVSPDWGIHTWLFNVDDNTFTFLENVLSEMLDLFPSRYVHLGGDEAVKDQWQQSAAVQAKRRELNLRDDMQLQSWFMGRLGKFLAHHDRRLIGWDEILEGGAPANATVMSWRGTKGAIEAARAGHDVVLSPAPDLYFDHLQSDAGDETPGRLVVIALADVYRYEAVPAELTPQQQAHVLGAQANLWTEHLRTNERVQRAAFPRAAALAEALWTPPAQRDWNDFLQRLAPMLARYRAADFAAADSAFAARFDAQLLAGRAHVAIANQSGFGTLRYTTDGRAPTSQSPAYTRPLDLPLGGTLTATAFAADTALAQPRRFVLAPESLLARGSHALPSCKGGLPLRLEDDAPRTGARAAGARAAVTRAVVTVDIFDPCWLYPQAPLDGVTQVSIRVGQLPYNFQLWHDAAKVVTRPPASDGGALEVRDGCEGALLASLPLAKARASDALTTLVAPLPPLQGKHDLCFAFAAGGPDPMWVIDEVTLLP